MNKTRYAKAIFGFFVLNRVSTDDVDTRFFGLVSTTFEDVPQHRNGSRRAVFRKTDNIQRKNGSPSHGIYVTEAIGRGDGSKHIGIVDDRGEEIDGLNDGELIVDTINGAVIGGFCTDEHIWIGDFGQNTQNLSEVFRTIFCRSPASSG